MKRQHSTPRPTNLVISQLLVIRLSTSAKILNSIVKTSNEMMSVQRVTHRITSPQIDTNCCIDHCQTANRRQNQVHGRPTWIGMSSVDCWLEIQTLHLHGQPVGWTLPPSSPMLRPGCAIDSTEPPKETARWATGGETSTPPTPPS